ncbi:MAG: ABC transporter permease subunit [Propionibacteriales bacterium]|nr:ABC transporter permease subunit [Propionibacteriales bacterium]
MTVWSYLEVAWADVLERFVEHLVLVTLSIILATAVGVLVGIVVYRSGFATETAMTVTNMLYTVPSLSYFVLVTPWLGIGTAPVLLIVVIYALLPIVRNAITGLQEVDPAVVKSAAAMGMTLAQQLARIELPLAWPVILAGIRVSTVLTAGMATIGGYVEGPGLGYLLFNALKAIGTPRAIPQAIVAIVCIVAVALLLDGALRGIGKFTTGRGLR